ncbi:adhesin P110 [Mycoplasmoides genitalium]|uniref:adhesin P110 n=1 Tax=Mycoplasmoides genitalium TaxID=2097 RepID=UPI00405536D9
MRKQIYKKAYWLLLPFLPLALANTFLVKEDSKNVTAYTPFATPITDSKSDLVSLAQLDSSYQIADQTIHSTNLFVLFKSRDVKVKYESSGSNTNTISFENNANKPSYVVEFTNSTNIGIKWSVVKKYQLDVPNVSSNMNEVLQNLILEQPLTKYTLNSSLAKEKGKSQREVHLGSNMANNWQSMRNQHDLNNNPSPNASTGFKLDKGNAYRKLSESWPIYQPIDGTKQGKGKDSSGWNSEENTAKNDAPLVSTSGGGSSKFQSYLNTKQALESIGILFESNGEARNVITQLYYASTSKLAVTNNHIVVMGNSFLPSLWYWVVDRSATTDSSSKPTWFANTTLNWGENKQKQFVENQLGYKETTSTNSHNFHSKSFTQPAYFISGIDSVNDQIIFSGFKAGSVGYDSSSSSSTKDQALAWSTTTSLDSKTGYRDLVTNDTGLNGPINGSFSIQDTFSFVVPYSSNHTNNGNTSGTIKTAYPVKKSEASTVMINSLINATPLNSYGDEGVGVFDALGLNYNFKSNQERLPSRTDQIFVYGIVSPNELRSAKSSADSTGSDTKVNWSNTQSRYLPVPYNYSEGIIDADGFKRPENRGASVTTFSGLKSIAPDGFANSIANFSVGLKAGIDPNPVMSGKKANYGAVVLTRGGVVRLNFNPGNDSLLSTTDNDVAPISFSFTPFTAAESAVDLTTFKEVTYNQESGLWSYVFDNSLKPTHDGKQIAVTDNKGFSVITVSRTGIELNQDQATTTLDVAPSALAVQSGIQSTTQTLTGVLPLSEEFSAVIAKDSGQNKIDIYKNNNGLFEIDTQLSNSVATNNGGLAPSYTENTVDAWGKVEFADNSVLQARNLVDKTVDEIINTPEILNSFFRFTPAFEDQKATLVATKQSDTSLSVSPRIQFLDGNFYDLNSTIAGVPLNIGFPSRVFAGFAALPAWVIPVSVGSSVGILFILLVLGLGIGIPMYRVRKLQDASFVNVFKKVDTLTTAVGSVYKKIITQTGVVKKAPSALKAANPSVKKPAAKPPVQPPSKPEGEQKAVEVKSEETKS